MTIKIIKFFLSYGFLCLALFFQTAFSQKSYDYQGNFKSVVAQLEDPENTAFYVNKITYSSKVPLSKYEFMYLSGLKVNTFITKRGVDKAFRQLMTKKRWRTIAIDMHENGTGKHLHFSLLPNWIFNTLEFEGLWFGKPSYATLYLQQPGDVFDAHLHEESLGAMKKFLYDQGYFKCQITDELVYSNKHQTLTVRIKVKRNARFFVNKLDMIVLDQEQSNEIELSQITRDVLLLLKSSLVDTFYSKKSLQKQVKKIKKLLKKRGFIGARVWVTKQIVDNKKPIMQLLLKIKLGKRKIIELEGNTIFDHEYLTNELIGADIPDWLFSSDIIAQHILNEYHKNGFWHTKVSAKPLAQGGYHFTIKEGEPISIDQVEVIDSHTHLPEKASQFLREFLKNKRCDQRLLDKTLDRLRNFYLTHGFWDFNIVDKRFVKNKNTNKYNVKIMTDKGQQRLWAGFTIEGFDYLEKSEFFKKYKSTRQSERIPFNLAWISQQRVFLLGYFQGLGYWYVSVEPELVTLSEHQERNIFVHWKIKLGPQVKFGKSIVRGNTSIPFERIQKQFAFKEGDLWRRDKLEATSKRLKRLGVFKTVQVQSYQLSKNKSKKPVILKLVDDEPVELRARVGYFFNSSNILFKGQSTPTLGVSFIVKNPTNRADKLALAGDWTRFERKFLLDYQQPSPFGLSAMSKINGFASKFIHPVQIKDSGSPYTSTQYGFKGELYDQYKESLLWSIILGNEWSKITRVHGNLNFNQNLINKFLPYFFIEPSITIDKLDDHINTTKGYFGKYSLKIMAPENKGDIMTKLLLEQSLFYPIAEKIIMAGRLRFGHVFKRKFENLLPTERFYLGGPNSVRGYEPDALPPIGVSTRLENGVLVEQFTIQGGGSMVNANLELRFPVYKSFGAILFQDIGILSQSGFLNFSGTWYPGSGFGFRYKTPIGSIRFDIGWQWKRSLQGDKRGYAWYLTLGEAF